MNKDNNNMKMIKIQQKQYKIKKFKVHTAATTHPKT